MVSQAARQSRIGFRVRDKNSGNILRFYYKKDCPDLFVDIRDKNDNRTTMEVVDVSNAGSSKTYKESVMEKIRQESPDKPEEVIEYEADLLAEGRKTIEELVRKGVNPELAFKLVRSALNDRIASEEDVKSVINAEKKEETLAE